VENPYAVSGLVAGSLFFAGYMLTQFPGGYLGDKFGYRTIIVISTIWAALATILTGLMTALVGLVAFRVITGLGEGMYYSNDRSVVVEQTPEEKRSFGLGVVITGLAIGITIALVSVPLLIDLGNSVFGTNDGWRMPFIALGAATLVIGIGIIALKDSGGEGVQAQLFGRPARAGQVLRNFLRDHNGGPTCSPACWICRSGWWRWPWLSWPYSWSGSPSAEWARR
jgi:MFS transporter, ACS family, D-galactonate transporter